MRLIESTKTGKRSMSGALVSVVLHSAIILLAVFATARAGIKNDKEDAHKVSFVKVKPSEPPPVKKDEPPPPKKPEPPKVKKSAPTPPKMTPVTPPPVLAPPKGFEVLKAPVTVPVSIPKIDLSKAITNEADFSGKGVAGGSAKGTAGGTGDKDSKGTEEGGDPNRTYFEFQVEQPVQPLGGAQPQYPESLRSSGEEGEVLAEFVVNENGRVEMSTFKVLNSSNPAFASAVRKALGGMRFRPAKIGGRSVSQVVQQPFQFKLNR
ncbi:MAG: energy transducer TonB [Gemmatimonadaceae bacterium]|nr:energy transducer TonB [Gemmatimonadaceae bacterium]